MQPIEIQKLQHHYSELFNSTPTVVRSPGRINLIGEHTDYNMGLVLPAAIDKQIVLCLGPSNSETCTIYSWDLQQQVSFHLNELTRSELNWANYIIGVVSELVQQNQSVEGFNCVFGGDIPLGAGLSSSAALECGLAFGLDQLFNLELSRLEIAKLSQAAERNFVGVQCGLMDQYANMFGKENHLIQLDCRSETHREVTVELGDYGLWLFNTNVKHELGDSEYNVRRNECETGVKQISKKYHQVTSLRDCDRSMLSEIVDPLIRTRCEYVIEETTRVVEGSLNLKKGELEAFGEKMYASHHGLSTKYQVSCPELDLLVDFTKKEEFVLGARMMGGGFGGCTINLIAKKSADRLISVISSGYFKQTGKEMSVYQVKIANGTSLMINF